MSGKGQICKECDSCRMFVVDACEGLRKFDLLKCAELRKEALSFGGKGEENAE